MSYHVLKNTWVGVTSEPRYKRENYVPEYNIRENYTCGKEVKSCEDEAKKNKCDKYFKVEDRNGTIYLVPCKKDPNKNKCKHNSAEAIKRPHIDNNVCGNTGNEMYICNNPCYPYAFFNKVDTCSGKDREAKVTDDEDAFRNKLYNCLSSYKTETPPDGDPYNVYCKATDFLTDNQKGKTGTFTCKPDADNKVDPPLEPV